ncbi:hypothetical protein C8D88_108219 [Lentzea atacamensis]|uniref:DUF2795 domain-containing protein n=1 Tax=Lentzea atacamensis TaxID=531938 RepID=A0A316HTB2_9PSEU|nr:hypothetical protein [Lentzea atacamensis]PWK84604.1 hypothetical protein C8D88_108219 [Lentzea atacamensis]
MEAVPTTSEPILTQTEIIDCVEDAFLSGATTVTDLLDAALRCQARPAVFAALVRLPERSYVSVMDVLANLPDLPYTAD